ncbi:protein FAR1-RELATED SEQUENCE 5-like [Salvia miltiorrhiza]|uniref:protein FAR1-RELATED SEQUENCE 5-like n=1 Tax=Salvia miltiorrhiza TaxID=226208 RepID=UPI0025AC01BF|nr:protein FAR1-RELATED SEQUENCE 5-like [Salvia miltiorrhiza]
MEAGDHITTNQHEPHFPTCDEAIKPYFGQVFDTLAKGVKFYEDYAKACGFEVRMSTIDRAKDGTIRSRYVVCNREGIWNNGNVPTTAPDKPKTKKRKTTSCRADCMAKAIFGFCPGGRYRLRVFIEGHTHSMVPAPTRHLMPSNREVSDIQQMIVIGAIKANIGPMRSFRMFKEIAGGYDKVGCTSNDVKNYVRDLNVYSKDSDAHMLLDAFTNKQELGRGFKFFHDVDEENKLCRLIWSDESAIENYKLFADAVSFDATYSTNKYKLIFTPFTGRDNHGKCISFGAALIFGEDMDSYSWVLEKFAEIMGNAPKVFVTDQDPGLKKAVASSWKETRHRFCMWHINIKVQDKLPTRLKNDPEFRSTYDNIVWTDNDDPDVFEENWNDMIEEYDLASNRWFSDMYEERMHWIPAFFRDVPMSGIFRTTSLSESENSYFKRFLNKNSGLVLLYTNYCSALDAQRHNYQKITLADETRVPKMHTELPIEKHAASIYTNSIFKEVQQEIQTSLIGCDIRKISHEGEDTIYDVEDNLSGLFMVRYLHSKDEVSCSCKLFVRKGTLCNHMFLVLKNLKFDNIPHKNIVKRWCKFSIIRPDEDYS